MNQGSSNRLHYDECAYAQKIQESTTPFQYRTFMGAYENADKCKYDKFWKPFDPEIIDVESELKNITRPVSKCTSLKYDSTCERSKSCISTFDKLNPVIYNYNVCPIIQNNIPKQKTNGIREPLVFLTKDDIVNIESNVKNITKPYEKSTSE